MKKAYHILLALAFVLGACDKEQENPQSPETACRLTTINVSNGENFKFAYDAGGSLKQLDWSVNGTDYTETYQYNNTGKLGKASMSFKNGADIDQLNYEYNQDNQLAKVSYFVRFTPGTALIHQWDEIYQYDNNTLVKVSRYAPGTNSPQQFSLFTFEGRNVRKIEVYNNTAPNPQLAEVREYTWGTARNPYTLLSPTNVSADQVSVNNMLTEKVTEGTQVTLLKTFTYELNQSLFPVKITETEAGKQAVIRTLGYQCN
jgi:hypothetical protein